MLTLKEFLQKYRPKDAELLDCCLPEEQAKLEGKYQRALSEKVASRPQGSGAFNQLVDAVDLAFGNLPLLQRLYSWDSVKEIKFGEGPALLGIRNCGRRFCAAAKGGDTDRARSLLDCFLYCEICDTCGARIFPGAEERAFDPRGKSLHYHSGCQIPSEMYGTSEAGKETANPPQEG